MSVLCVCRTPLMLAVGAGHTECVILLLNSKADVDVVDKDRHPPLFRAVSLTSIYFVM